MDAQPPEPRLPALNHYTALTPIRLVTPAALSRALELVGVTWKPTDDPSAWLTSGLYAWVADTSRGLLESGCIYIGMADRSTGRGLSDRLEGEASWVTPEHAHGHGMAAYRLNAHVVAGRAYSELVDLDWLEDIDIKEKYRNSVITLCREPLPLPQIEALAIRLSAHLGDTVAPLNSKHASAWAYNTDIDRMAWTIAYYLTTTTPC